MAGTSSSAHPSTEANRVNIHKRLIIIIVIAPPLPVFADYYYRLAVSPARFL